MNNKAYIPLTLVFCLVVGGAVVSLVDLLVVSDVLKTIRITQIFSLLALTFLYLTLLISPMLHSFPRLPFASELKFLKKYLGISAFFFALLHSVNAMQNQLGGLVGLTYLSNNFLFAILLGMFSSLILSLLFLISFQKIRNKLSPKLLNIINRSLYLGSITIVIHALMIGSHFEDLSEFIPQIFIILILILLILESIRLDNYLKRILFVPITVISSIGVFILSQTVFSNLGIHSSHSASVISSSNSIDMSAYYMPGMMGNPKKSYSVQFSQNPQEPNLGENVEFSFKIFDKDTLSPQLIFATPYEKPMHLIIISEDLRYFSHVHPEAVGLDGTYKIQSNFPHSGDYRMYLDFQPLGAIEQQQSFPFKVIGKDLGVPPSFQYSNIYKDANYEISMQTQSASATKLSKGEERIKINLKRSDGSDVKNITPYLNSFGHLILINEKTFEYIHGHNLLKSPPKPGDLYGPDLEFAIMPMNKKMSPGNYHVFFQSKPDDVLILSRFYLKINE